MFRRNHNKKGRTDSFSHERLFSSYQKGLRLIRENPSARELRKIAPVVSEILGAEGENIEKVAKGDPEVFDLFFLARAGAEESFPVFIYDFSGQGYYLDKVEDLLEKAERFLERQGYILYPHF